MTQQRGLFNPNFLSLRLAAVEVSGELYVRQIDRTLGLLMGEGIRNSDPLLKAGFDRLLSRLDAIGV